MLMLCQAGKASPFLALAIHFAMPETGGIILQEAA
jgi:hypothetical protein